jgi:heat shock protein HslJ
MTTITALLPRRLFLLFAALAVAGLATSCKMPAPDRPTMTWSLTGTVWKLVELNGQAVGSSKLPSLTLDAATGRVSGLAGVNRYSGTFKQQDAAISFGPLAVTKMAGPEKDMKIETEFLAALPRVTAWKLDGLMLSLFAGETEVARFQGLPAGAPLD